MSDNNPDCTVTVDANGKRHFRMKADPGKLGTFGAPLGGDSGGEELSVELGPHLVTLPDSIRASYGGKISGNEISVLYEDGHEMGVMVGDMRMIFVFPSVATRREKAEQIRKVFGD
jgi:hypothetical protein